MAFLRHAIAGTVPDQIRRMRSEHARGPGGVEYARGRQTSLGETAAPGAAFLPRTVVGLLAFLLHHGLTHDLLKIVDAFIEGRGDRQNGGFADLPLE